MPNLSITKSQVSNFGTYLTDLLGGLNGIFGNTTTTNATTTSLSFTGLTSTYLAVNGLGQVIATTTPVGGSGSVAWGAITGTLGSQTDLQNALNLKIDNSTTSLSNLGVLAGLYTVGSSTGQTTIFGQATMTNASTTNLTVATNSYLGTVLSGTWNGSAVGAGYGGTGQTSYAVGDLLYGSGAITLSKLADVSAGSYLRSGGVTTAPVWSTLKLPNAGTAYRLPVYTSANTMGELASVGATGQYLAGATGAIPVWATLNQSAVAGLTTSDSPTFAGVTLNGNINLSAGYAYQINGAPIVSAQTNLSNYFFGEAGNLTMTGIHNLANGSLALHYNTTGSDNTGIGYVALLYNTIGRYNVANGSGALDGNTTGFDNTGIGYAALTSNTTGSDNTGIGSGSDVLSNNLTNATAIGFNAKVGGSNMMVLGGTGEYAVKVGIGNTIPASSLHIGDNLANTSLYIGATVDNGMASSKQLINYSNSVTTGSWTGTGLDIHNNDITNGNWSGLSFSSSDGTANLVGGAIGTSFTGRVAGNFLYGDLGFFTRAYGAMTEKMRITSDGKVGIGTSLPAYTLDVVGTIRANSLTNGTVYSNGGVLTNVNPSSQTYKDNINPATLNLDALLGLQVKSFTWKNNGQNDYGLIAEEVKAALPDLYVDDGITKGYRLDHLTFYLLQIAQRQEAELTALKATLGTAGLSVDSGGNLTVKSITADKLCLGATCITETELKSLLGNVSSSPISTPSTPPILPDPFATSSSSTSTDSGSDTSTTTPVITDPTPPIIPDPMPPVDPPAI